MNINTYKQKIKINEKLYNILLKKTAPIRKNFIKIYKKLNKDELKSLDNYKGSGYNTINMLLYENKLNIQFNNKITNMHYLIQNQYDDVKKHILELDKIINYYKSPSDITVFRGIFKDKKLDKLKVNQTIVFSNYLSTSINIDVAFKFSAVNNNNIKLLEITLPKGTNMLYLPWEIKNKNKNKIKNEILRWSEFELLLGRNYEFKLNKISYIDNKYFILDKMNWKKYLSSKYKKNKIKIFHLSFTKQINCDIPTLNNIRKNINWNNIINEYNSKNLFYIPSNIFINKTNIKQ
jgi:hypothetical protein